MSLRDQPYIPLYVNDFYSDEKVRKCSAASVGVYIMLMCFLHKSETYGAITLTEREKKYKNPIKNFAFVLVSQIGFTFEEIEAALDELTYFGIIQIEGDTLSQKRMVKDGELSKIRAESGAKGGRPKGKQTKSKTKANQKQNTEYENEYEYEYENKDIDNSYSLDKQAENLGDRFDEIARRVMEKYGGEE